ncbi:DNA methyltransferase [Methylophilus flavus]|uniref:site-specific DNA-methyltransferase (adenine-specific) n=1 Tax=Methylophilus flavus TaxID=640084 RepID=A0ABW3P6Z7_9PROT
MIQPVQIGLATLHNMPCKDFMRTVPDNYFDLAIVDPPYFEGPNKSGYYGKGYSNLGVPRGKHYDSLESWEVPDAEYFNELKRISKNQIIWGANHFADELKSSSPAWLVWDKDNGESSFADVELAYTSFKTAARIFRYRWHGMIQGYQGNKRLNQTRIHPTQKPIQLYEYCLANYAKAGQKIFDSHLGSGSHAIACNNFGFELVACEKDKSMFEKSCEWIAQELKQERLFA